MWAVRKIRPGAQEHPLQVTSSCRSVHSLRGAAVHTYVALPAWYVGLDWLSVRQEAGPNLYPIRNLCRWQVASLADLGAGHAERVTRSGCRRCFFARLRDAVIRYRIGRWVLDGIPLRPAPAKRRLVMWPWPMTLFGRSHSAGTRSGWFSPAS